MRNGDTPRPCGGGGGGHEGLERGRGGGGCTGQHNTGQPHPPDVACGRGQPRARRRASTRQGLRVILPGLCLPPPFRIAGTARTLPRSCGTFLTPSLPGSGRSPGSCRFPGYRRVLTAPLHRWQSQATAPGPSACLPSPSPNCPDPIRWAAFHGGFSRTSASASLQYTTQVPLVASIRF